MNIEVYGNFEKVDILLAQYHMQVMKY